MTTGFIAQELQQVFPWAVTTKGCPPGGLPPAGLIPGKTRSDCGCSCAAQLDNGFG
jgi:hypothetical protein